MNISINRKTDALLVIDLQNDFCPGGALAVAGGDEIADGIIEMARQFKHVVLTQDWHPAGHSSFASTHGKPAFSSIRMPYGEQTLWPDHCVQGQAGAAFVAAVADSALDKRARAIVRKGMDPAIDSYSAFFENDRTTPTGLAGFLQQLGIQRLFVVGLAYDFCVRFSALDAVRLGFQAVVLQDLTRAIDMEAVGGGTKRLTTQAFAEAGVMVCDSAAVARRDATPGATGSATARGRNP